MTLRAVFAASFLVVAGLCRAQGAAFTAGELSADGQALYRVNFSARTATRIGFVKANGGAVSSLAGLTFGSDGQLYALGTLAGATQPSLLMLNQSLGSASVVSQLGGIASSATTALSLSFSCDGHLWMTSADTSNFWELTPSTGQTRLVGNLGVKITAMAARGNVLYGIGGSGNANLYSIATANAKATLIGPYNAGAPNPVDGGFDTAGVLWGLLRNFDGSTLPTQLNTLVQIDPATGALTTVGTIANPGQSGLTFPVPFNGLAVAAPACGSVPPPPPAEPTFGAPAISPAGLGAFVFSLLVSAYLALLPLRRRS